MNLTIVAFFFKVSPDNAASQKRRALFDTRKIKNAKKSF
jgi:hypothetical protein